jgi:phage gp16-like protein
MSPTETSPANATENRASAADRRPPRNRDLARIHILKSQLKLDDESYRNVLWTVGRVDSSKDLDMHGRKAVIEHLEAHLARRDPKAAQYRSRPHNADTGRRKPLRKIEAYLADAGRPWAYVEEMARHMYGKQRIVFCDGDELAGLVAALDAEAKKRLIPALEAELKAIGEGWRYAKIAACECFDLPVRRDVQASAQAMSQVLRWLQGRLAPSCSWPQPAPSTDG